MYRLLVEENETLQFLSREEAPKEIQGSLPGEEGEAPGVGVSPTALPLAEIDSAAVADRHTDRNLQTLLGGQKLQTRLVFLAREAASALEEQGYNILYLTLGMVHWQEAGGDDRVCGAPLLFVPVELERKTVQSRYSIRLVDDDILTNPCLAELSSRTFKFDLPSFDSLADVSIDQHRLQFDSLG